MAPLTPFCNLTNIYFSTLPSEYEEQLNEEIWGCFRQIGIPYDTLMNMSIRKRKDLIFRHNREYEEMQSKQGGSKTTTISGEMINQFAMMEMNNKMNRRGGF